MNKVNYLPRGDSGYGIRSILPHSGMIQRIDAYIPSDEARKRKKWMDHYETHKNAAFTARHFGISERIFWKWYKRYKEEGMKGLEDQSRRPDNVRESLIPQSTITLVCRIRKDNPFFSKYKIHQALLDGYGIDLGTTSIEQIMLKNGLILPRESQRRKKASLSPVQRISRQVKQAVKHPGDLVHIDTKHLYLVGGRKAFHFTAIDALTRFKFAWVHSSITSASSAKFLDEAFSYFPFPVKAMVSDNGSEYHGQFDQKLNRLGIEHYFIYPHSPKQNGIVERAIRTDIEEFYHAGNLETTIHEQNKKIEDWNEYYNYKRYHRSLNCLTPAQFLDTFILPQP